MTKFNTNYLECLPFSDYTLQFVLAANTESTYIVQDPTGTGLTNAVYRCEFSFPANANVWVGYNYPATVPSPGFITDTENQSLALNPKVRYVRSGDVLSFISDSIVLNAGFELLLLPS